VVGADEHHDEAGGRVGAVVPRVASAVLDDGVAGSQRHLGAIVELERTALEWARKVNAKSPTAQRMLKFAFNLLDDGLVGQQLFAGEATRLAYGTDEAQEGRDAFLQKRDPDFTDVPWYF
jgi:1,4-dihydroxy-2-naphthoyl-CoA synthase